jgi:peptidoglycan/LPS O-acetylase OafA/YrhL
VSNSDDLNSALWSLKWEVLFSLLLPLYVVFGATLRRLWPAKILLLFSLILLGLQDRIPSLEYLPLFAVGVVIAFHTDDIVALSTSWRRSPRCGLFTAGFALLVVVLITADSETTWIAVHLRGQAGLWFDDLVRLTTMVGAAGAVVFALYWPRSEALGQTRVLRWLGSRSFALYLVHVPILVAVAIAFDGRANPLILLLVALPIILAVTEVFHRSVDERAVRVGRRLGDAVAARLARRGKAALAPSAEAVGQAGPAGSMATSSSAPG